uniref:Uncharacterized protein n=1 Tax=Anguilla anguilla TaxID=7936 RepID=A0A0E9S294_ANGAN
MAWIILHINCGYAELFFKYPTNHLINHFI